jgi:hypothetical protein
MLIVAIFLPSIPKALAVLRRSFWCGAVRTWDLSTYQSSAQPHRQAQLQHSRAIMVTHAFSSPRIWITDGYSSRRVNHQIRWRPNRCKGSSSA